MTTAAVSTLSSVVSTLSATVSTDALTTDDYRPFIGIMLPNANTYSGIVEAMLTGFNVASFTDYTAATVSVYFTDGTTEATSKAVTAFLVASTRATTRCFVAGVTTNQFRDALTLLDGTDVLVLSLGSTYTNISSFPNISQGYSLCYSDSKNAYALVNMWSSIVPSTKPYPKLYILYNDQSLYSTGFRDDVIAALRSTISNGPKLFATYSVSDSASLGSKLALIQQTITTYDIVLYTTDSNFLAPHISYINTTFPDSVFFYMTDGCDGVDFAFADTVYASVLLPKYTVYSNNTINLYASIYRRNHLLKDFASFVVPFAFDAARQLHLLTSDLRADLTPENFLIRRSDAFYVSSALSSNWVQESLRRPAYAHFLAINFLDTQWSSHVSDFASLVLGSSLFLPSSCAVGTLYGISGSEYPNGMYVEIMTWQIVLNKFGDWIFTQLDCNDLIVNTALSYQNNFYRSVNSGVYVLIKTIKESDVSIKTTGSTQTVQIVNDLPFSYPIRESVVRLQV